MIRLLTLLATAMLAAPACAATLEARVVAIGTGSALAVLGPDEKLRRVKLIGVDAPEKTQPYGEDARKLLGEWLTGRTIPVRYEKVDKDGRIFGQIQVGDTDLGLRLIEAGLAWCDPADAPDLDTRVRERYWEACARAKALRQGLWRDPNPMPPWEHRRIPQFKPIPGPSGSSDRTCQAIGQQQLQCDDDIRYRRAGEKVYGSDGVIYSRRGHTITGTDGSHYERQGSTVYGADGSVCRTRGRQVSCY